MNSSYVGHRPEGFRFTALPLAGVLAWLVLLAQVYGYAAGMAWQFDDYVNLKDLSQASDRNGLLNFVFGGQSGPSGRPLSLLTFVANYGDWPGHPWGVARINVLIHGLNTLLAVLLFRRLYLCLPQRQGHGWAWAAIAAILWATLAIHASGILMPVQRMTIASGFFVLLTLWLYVALRQHYAGRQGWLPMLNIIAIVGAGTALAILCKESGALTISLIAAMETFWMRHIPPPAPKRLWRLGIILAWLAIPSALAVKYLWLGYGGLMGVYTYYRPFSLPERLATESVILWEYVRQTLIPRAALLGPFHDGHAIYNWHMIQPWLASLAWALALGIAMMAARRGGTLARAVLLAAVFFLISHQIESAYIPLELYFEHRNYIATLCLAFAGALALAHLWHTRSAIRLRLIGATSLLLVLAWQLQATYQVSSAFGQPMLGAELWHHYHPASPRAAQTLAWHLDREGFREAALKVMDDFQTAHPHHAEISVQALVLSCKLHSEKASDHRQRLSGIVQALAERSYASGLTTGLRDLGNLARDEKCDGIDPENYYEFLQSAIRNEAILHSPQIRHHFDFELSLTAEKMGLPDQSIRYARDAFKDMPSVGAGQRLVTLLFRSGQLDQAIEWANRASSYAPDGVRRWAWKQNFDSMEEALESIRNHIEAPIDN